MTAAGHRQVGTARRSAEDRPAADRRAESQLAAGLGTGDPAGGNTGGGAASSGPASGGGSAAAAGTVKLVDGSTIYVQTASGELITIRTNGKTAVRVPGKLGDLKPGDRVSLEGGPAGDGEVTASTITGSR
ncbi:hypothetical protein ACFFWC_05230 [Plantactinospora siamensis]|uniref:DUF5666 domain-containing protein n=1 Tax=Plantactinospora siamensis TaxID=555372 RepID=A0ABV6NRL2_9ACTN